MTEHFSPNPATEAGIRKWLVADTIGNVEQRESDEAVMEFLRGSDSTEYVKALLPSNRRPVKRDWDQARTNSVMWQSINLSPNQVKEWLHSGAQPWEHDLVGGLIQQGLSPTSASQQREHANTGERTTAIEIGRNTTHNALRSDLSDALDDAGIERIPIEHPYETWLREYRRGRGIA